MISFLRGPALAMCVVVVFCTAAIQAEEPVAADPPIEKHKLGHYQIQTKGTPAKLWLDLLESIGGNAKPDAKRAILAGEVTWFRSVGTFEVVAPESYKPGVPHGVLVFVNSADSGLLPAAFHPLLEKHRLIAIGANQSGNDCEVATRHALAVYAVDLIRERYDVDTDRVYVTGLSGGGRVASQVMIIRSDVFTGGLPYVGANPCIPMMNADSKGKPYKAEGSWRKPDPRLLRRAREQGRYAFITGETDYNRPNVRAVHDGYKANGFRHIEYIEQPGLGHGQPSAEYFEKALMFLDAPLIAAAEKHYQQAQRMDRIGRKDQALAEFRKAAAHGGDAQWRADAQAKAAEYQAAYDAVMVAIEEAIEQQDRIGFQRGVAQLRRDWRAMVDTDQLRALVDRFKQAGE